MTSETTNCHAVQNAKWCLLSMSLLKSKLHRLLNKCLVLLNNDLSHSIIVVKIIKI